MQYKIMYSCISHIGKVRTKNQDNFICSGLYFDINKTVLSFPLHGERTSNEQTLLGIFDGMGGEECGEIASYLAAKEASNLSITNDLISALKEFCQSANTEICAYAAENEISAMGTTAAILAFSPSGIALCNIGDSKIFRFSGCILEQISKDHIAVSAFGVKPPLSQNLGIPPTELEIDPYLAQGTYNDGDIYLICSDGLTDMVTTKEVEAILITSKDINEATKSLLETALIHGGRDNITIILCKIERKPSWILGLKQSLKKRGKGEKHDC